MSQNPSDFLQFLKDHAKPKDGKLFLTVEIGPNALELLIVKAKQNETPAEPVALLPPSPTDEDLHGSDEEVQANDSSALEACRGEAKKALANLIDKRSALQVIVAIADKELGQ